MNLETMRLVVTTNMPYDKGFMFMAGSKYYETEHFILCSYDTERVSYIVYNEEGTIFSTKNQFFIRRQTIGDLIRHASYEEAGLRAPVEKYEKRAKRRASYDMVGQGTIDKLRGDSNAGNI